MKKHIKYTGVLVLIIAIILIILSFWLFENNLQNQDNWYSNSNIETNVTDSNWWDF